ncbi:MAG: CARDB domain-containing protein [bacterium]|nr:CARDB domain-containing protein [bacterium]
MHNANIRRSQRMVSLLILSVMVSAFIALSGAPNAAAQDTIPPAATNTPLGPLGVSGFEPTQVLNGQASTITVFGTNFASNTVVRLVGAGVVSTTLVNSSTLTASLPANLTPGAYQVQVVDPARGTVAAGVALQVFGPTPTPFPIATFTIPTPQPGRPNLIIRNFRAEPASIEPGDTTTLVVEVVNTGSRPAEGITLALGEGSFTPAIGESTVTIPTINPGGTFEVSLTVVAAANAEAGPQSVPIVLAYRDFEGENYTSNSTLSVTILDVAVASQVTISGYAIAPNPVIPGNPAVLRVDVTNTGTVTVNSALLRIAGDSSILLAGERGDSIPLGDIAPGDTASAELPMIVSAAAEPGPKSQPVTLSYFRENEREETTTRITINVANPTLPVLLLQDYATGRDVLRPGDTFTLSMVFANVGDAAAGNALLTFGTVTTTPPTSGGGSGSGSGNGGTGGTSGSSTTTDGIPGNAFAPLGSGNTIFVGDMQAGGTVAIEQEFIVNGRVTSGIYNLPITIRYRTPTGASGQENLQASIVVVAPPRIQSTLINPLPPQVNIGEGVPLTLEIRNNGTATVDLTRVVVSADNADIPDGAEQELSPVRTDDDATVDVVIFPLEEGPTRVTFTIFYMDDLANERSLDLTFDSEAVQPPPMPEFTPPPDMFPIPTEEPEADLLSRLLLGFLGLGG